MSGEKLTVNQMWVMGDAAGIRYLGQVLPDFGTDADGFPVLEAGKAIRLSPCYEVQMQQMQRPDGGTVMGVQVSPYALLGHPRPVAVSLSSIVRIGDLHEDDRAMVVSWVVEAEKIRTSIRATRAGIRL